MTFQVGYVTLQTMKSIGWIDANGCESQWHEIVIDDEGRLKLNHLNDEECQVAEYDLSEIREEITR